MNIFISSYHIYRIAIKSHIELWNLKLEDEGKVRSAHIKGNS